MTPDPAGSPPPADERAPDDAPTWHVFLGYNSQDEVAVASAKVIFEALESEGKRVWYDKKDRIAGRPSDEVMADGIQRSGSCAMLHGPQGLGRWQESYELKVALDRTIEDPTTRLFAVLLPGSAGPLPPSLKNPTVADLTDGFTDDDLSEAGLLELLAAVEDKSVREVEEARRGAARPAGGARAAGTSAAARPHRALLVSVSKYDDPKLRDLHGPPFDAHELQAALENARMPRGSEWKVAPCAEPDYDALGKRLREFFLDEGLSGGTALFYYSGHGVVHSGESYVCATNTDTTDISWTAMPAARIVDLVNKCPAQSKVIILDCCHAATIVSSAYAGLGEDVAVVLASRGQADDAPVSGPSPFTSKIVEALGDTQTTGERALTVGLLLDALEGHGSTPWTTGFARDIVLATPGERVEPPPKESAPAISVRVAPADPKDVRLPIVRQLAATLDGLLAIAREKRQVLSSTVRETMDMLASELRRLTGDQLRNLEAVLENAPDELPKTCAVSFADGAPSDLVELPWEYLGLCGSTPPDSPLISIERVFEAPATKYAATPEIQKVVLFSSLEGEADESVHPLTAATKAELKLSPEDVVPRAKWSQFTGAPDADVVILQAPVWLKSGDLKVVFAGPRAGEPNDVAAVHATTHLQRRPTLMWLLVETIAEDPDYHSALAVRKLAYDLASKSKRPVVGICHSPAYMTALREALRENPNATTFLGQLIAKLRLRWPLDRAAYNARESVVSSLGLNDPSIIGFPVVMRPVEPQAPVAERAAARR